MALSGAIFTGLGGAAAGATLAAYHAGQPGADLAALQNTFVYGFQTAFHVCAAIAAIGIFTALVRGREEPRRAAPAH